MKSSTTTRSLEHLDRFISKLAKPLSEFVILSILHQNPDIHTYEIQQILLEKFQKNDDPIASSMRALEDILDQTIESENDNKTENLISQFPIPHLRQALRDILDQRDENARVRDLLVKLREDLEVSNLLNTGTGKIWMTISGIYQTMKELEKYDLIIISRQEIVNGRTRKLYRITDLGRKEAIKMLFTFISLNQFAIPRNFEFSDELAGFYEYHNQSFRELVNLIGLQEFDHQDVFSPENPFVQNQPMVVNQFQLILQQLLFTENTTELRTFYDKMSVIESSTKKVLKQKLEDYNEKLSEFIKFFD